MASRRRPHASLAVTDQKGRRFLAIGSGDGTRAIAVGNDHRRYWSLDPAQEAIGIARLRDG